MIFFYYFSYSIQFEVLYEHYLNTKRAVRRLCNNRVRREGVGLGALKYNCVIYGWFLMLHVNWMKDIFVVLFSIKGIATENVFYWYIGLNWGTLIYIFIDDFLLHYDQSETNSTDNTELGCLNKIKYTDFYYTNVLFNF